jgi:hypothetical protein
MNAEPSKRQQKRARAREMLAMMPIAGTRIRARDGVRLCIKHGKRWYPSESEAGHARGEIIRAGTHDPGLEAYPCAASKGWHLGHHGRWRSLDRLIEEGA